MNPTMGATTDEALSASRPWSFVAATRPRLSVAAGSRHEDLFADRVDAPDLVVTVGFHRAVNIGVFAPNHRIHSDAPSRLALPCLALPCLASPLLRVRSQQQARPALGSPASPCSDLHAYGNVRPESHAGTSISACRIFHVPMTSATVDLVLNQDLSLCWPSSVREPLARYRSSSSTLRMRHLNRAQVAHVYGNGIHRLRGGAGEYGRLSRKLR
jgi:hypothetical protein